jgi:hypothetical protein
MQMRVLGLLLLMTLIFSLNINSQTCCSGGVPLSNNIGLPTAKKGILQIGMSYDYNNLNTLNDESTKLDDSNRLRVTHSFLLNFGYSITDKLSVEGLFSYVNQRRRILTNNTLSQSSGIGDAILLTRYVVLDKNNWTFSIGGGVKLPTGSTDKKNDLGITLNADLQPGSNALDAILITSVSKQFNFRKSLTFSSRLTYRDTGTNNEYQKVNNYKFGNETQVFFSVADQFFLFNKLFYPNLTVKYRRVLNDEINSKQISNTGGKWVFLRPSFSLGLTDSVNFSSSLEVPIYSKVEGIQLTPTFRLNFGVLIQLFKDKNRRKIISNIISK